MPVDDDDDDDDVSLAPTVVLRGANAVRSSVIERRETMADVRWRARIEAEGGRSKREQVARNMVEGCPPRSVMGRKAVCLFAPVSDQQSMNDYS